MAVAENDSAASEEIGGTSPWAFLFYLLSSLTLLFTYVALSKFFVPYGGLHFNQFAQEAGILLIILFLLYIPQLPNPFLKYAFPPLYLLCFYIGYDVFYLYFRTPLNPLEISNLVSLWFHAPFVTLGIVFFLLLPIFWIFFGYAWVSFRGFSQKCLQWLVVLVLCFTPLLEEFIRFRFLYSLSHVTETVYGNGRITASLFFMFEQLENYRQLKGYRKYRHLACQVLYPHPIKKKPNIYIIVMESFVSPYFIKGFRTNVSLIPEELYSFMPSRSFSLVKSPVYGKGSAQTYFELLTGVPALRLVNPIEFNVMEGAPLEGFLTCLKKEGYRLIGISTGAPVVFNSFIAYRSLGISVSFLRSFPRVPEEMLDENSIFDGDLFQIAREKIESLKDNSPYLFFLAGTYGHYPYLRDKLKRPDVLRHPDPDIEAIANQFYYRTRALADFLTYLTQRDPEAIIYVTSDHLPPAISPKSYTKGIYDNIALFLYQGRPLSVTGLHQYEIPWLIWSILRGEKNRRKVPWGTLKKIYFSVLAQSLH